MQSNPTCDYTRLLRLVSDRLYQPANQRRAYSVAEHEHSVFFPMRQLVVSGEAHRFAVFVNGQHTHTIAVDNRPTIARRYRTDRPFEATARFA